MLLGRNFDDIDGATIHSLIDSGANESVHLEFKRESYGSADKDKRELLKDVSSFANCLGGHLVIGVEEKGGAACELHPLTNLDVDKDKELQRLDMIVRTCIEPAIVGLRMKPISVRGGDVIIMHVPRSHNPPHRVIFRNSNRYYSRSSAGVHELRMEELRELFGERRTIEAQAMSFIDERFLIIQAGDAAMPLPAGKGTTVIHLVPLPDLGARRRIDIATMKEHRSKFKPMRASSISHRVNLDGLVVYSGGDYCHAYTQIFRNGSLEAVSTDLIREQNGSRFIPSVALPQMLVGSLTAYINGLRALEASPPILMRISSSGMRGVKLGMSTAAEFSWGSPSPCERESLHLPHSIITEYGDAGSIQPVIAEQMDFLWNAFDLERCHLFDENGFWKGEQ